MPCTTHVWKNHVKNSNSNEYKLTAIVLDIARSKLCKPVGIKKDEIDKRSFLRLSFANEDLHAINLSKILLHKSVKSDDDQIRNNEL